MHNWQRNEHPALHAEQARTAALLRLRDEWVHYLEYKQRQLDLRKEQADTVSSEPATANQPHELQPGAVQ